VGKVYKCESGKWVYKYPECNTKCKVSAPAAPTQPPQPPTSDCKKDITGAYNPACCCADSDCPTGQTCDIPNGYCKSGKSCNEFPGQKHRECRYDAAQGKSICVWVPGPGVDNCAACLPTQPPPKPTIPPVVKTPTPTKPAPTPTGTCPFSGNYTIGGLCYYCPYTGSPYLKVPCPTTPTPTTAAVKPTAIITPSPCRCINNYWQGDLCDSWMRGRPCGITPTATLTPVRGGPEKADPTVIIPTMKPTYTPKPTATPTPALKCPDKNWCKTSCTFGQEENLGQRDCGLSYHLSPLYCCQPYSALLPTLTLKPTNTPRPTSTPIPTATPYPKGTRPCQCKKKNVTPRFGLETDEQTCKRYNLMPNGIGVCQYGYACCGDPLPPTPTLTPTATPTQVPLEKTCKYLHNGSCTSYCDTTDFDIFIDALDCKSYEVCCAPKPTPAPALYGKLHIPNPTILDSTSGRQVTFYPSIVALNRKCSKTPCVLDKIPSGHYAHGYVYGEYQGLKFEDTASFEVYPGKQTTVTLTLVTKDAKTCKCRQKQYISPSGYETDEQACKKYNLMPNGVGDCGFNYTCCGDSLPLPTAPAYGKVHIPNPVIYQVIDLQRVPVTFYPEVSWWRFSCPKTPCVFEDVPPGSYSRGEITGNYQGLIFTNESGFTVSAGKKTEVVLSLVTSPVEGQATSEQSLPSQKSLFIKNIYAAQKIVVPYAQITFIDNYGRTYKTTADRNGRYKIDLPVGPEYKIYVTAPNYKTLTDSLGTVEANKKYFANANLEAGKKEEKAGKLVINKIELFVRPTITPPAEVPPEVKPLSVLDQIILNLIKILNSFLSLFR